MTLKIFVSLVLVLLIAEKTSAIFCRENISHNTTRDVKCEGKQDSCKTITKVVEVRGKMITEVEQQCANSDICKLACELSGEAHVSCEVDCCDEDYCNSDATINYMVILLISCVIFAFSV